ncbi:lachesin-like [Ctenocephalides felis]|uniref:lachesin-like n=1 Tax=Ctenocephalides felis TaxID=7515 RepID=UPI000E6E1EF1|nr:lachesin-like [Ctenocephalides felis]
MYGIFIKDTCKSNGHAFQPEFAEPIVNLTVAVGRDATFRCLVLHLGGYRVGWVKADTKAIQAIHDHVITHNPRVSVSHSDHSTWNLHIRDVAEEDRGMYMCQINTDPMKSQLGYLDVVVPPDFVAEDTSGDVMVPEGGVVKLTCRARGQPVPHVQWRREDGGDIVIREPSGQKTKVSSYQGEVLKLSKITRSEMGAYLCIANNHVPPAISKRIMVNVHFPPVIQVPNQLVGAPLGTDVTLECYVEASPKSINYWIRDTGGMVISSNKYEVGMSSRSLFETRMSVTIRRLQLEDVGSYRCIAKNSLGDVESNIRLYEIPGPTRRVFHPRYDEEDYPDGLQFGSAERDPDDNDEQTIAGSNQAISSSGTSGRGGSAAGHSPARGGQLSAQSVPGPLSPSVTADAYTTRNSHSLLIFALAVGTMAAARIAVFW